MATASPAFKNLEKPWLYQYHDRTEIDTEFEGVSVTSLCSALRRLAILRQLAQNDALVVLCDIKTGHSDAIEVTLSTNGGIPPSDKESSKLNSVVEEAADKMADIVSHRKTNSSMLAAVIEVKIETTIINTNIQKSASYLIPLLCSILGLIGLVAVILLVVWHNRHKQRLNCYRHESQPLEQKSNKENEENLRRYRNPLFDTDKGGGTGKNTSTELIEIDIEKYEKSPRRLVGRTDSNNDSKQNTPPLKTPKKKDINIEISRTMTADREVIV